MTELSVNVSRNDRRMQKLTTTSLHGRRYCVLPPGMLMLRFTALDEEIAKWRSTS